MTTGTYSHGHHESVLRSHRWRTAENSAAFLLPRLKSGVSLLDVGCGPGNLTRDLAARVAPGRVAGVDAAADAIAAARSGPESGGAEFLVGHAGELPFGDGRWDVVFAHQLLQHVADPLAALREMKRVAKPGGTVAVRDSDYAGFVWAPASPLLSRWNELYHAIARRNGGEPDAGRFLPKWAREAGFREVAVSSSTWTFADPPSRQWWGGLWADRVLQSDFATQAVDYGLSERGELEAIAGAWRRWAADEDGIFVVLHGEVLARA